MADRTDVKISVIVPVYNVEKELPRCIESLLTQTYSNFELLLINDGSSDGSPEIMERYAEKDPRIRTLHKKNGGVSSARNRGLEQAKGEYVGFDICPWMRTMWWLRVIWNGFAGQYKKAGFLLQFANRWILRRKRRIHSVTFRQKCLR